MAEIGSGAGAPEAVSPHMSPLARVVAIYTRPAEAWHGLEQRAQFWFPLLFTIVLWCAFGLLLHQRAVVPMMEEAWAQQVADGQMTAEQAEGALAFMAGPAGLAFTAIQQGIAAILMFLITALVIWFGVGFVLGTRMKYRHAFEVATWSSFIQVPALVITAALAWFQGSMRGVHVGFGALLPAMETPTKFGIALRTFLDAIGPLAIWYVAVGILGAAALSGAPRKSVAWVLGSLYIAVALFMSAMAALFAPGA